ncbi:hypothetical protein L596_026505 [Steinernema carpocapsae]|uniref:SCP2 domain-containing protein n=1 Tax=Steinernema carpocapsae TaxID=34508 RepID=A0A4U5M1L0_STECR|nr:hypothetical protein L596_026505 [Steinernema carpocapsae]
MIQLPNNNTGPDKTLSDMTDRPISAAVNDHCPTMLLYKLNRSRIARVEQNRGAIQLRRPLSKASLWALLIRANRHFLSFLNILLRQETLIVFIDTAVDTPAAMTGALKSELIFDEIKTRAVEEEALAREMTKKANGKFRITVSGDGGVTKTWTIDASAYPPTVEENEHDKKVDVHVTVKDEDFMKMAAGSIKPDQAFMQGKLKLKGNLAKAMKLKALLDPKMLKAKI